MSGQDTQFDQAVRLAAAFVANGDIRLDGGTRRDQIGLDKLKDLIETLHELVGDARDGVRQTPHLE